ncbi:MAG TPA: TetR/AcrR family transcriptional regulator [Solirubrobacteraceae bacterium]|jgi:AcrR family transcriptional regulator
MAAERAGAHRRKANAAQGLRRAGSITGLQRTRLLGAAVGVLGERGHAGFTAAAVCERAGISRRTFYEVFENCEQCFAAIITDTEQRANSAIASLELDQLAWSERVRMGLWTLLCLADEDQALARVCLVESQRACGLVQAERERIIARLVDALDDGRAQGTSVSAASRLTAEALVGAVSSVLATRLAQATASHGSSSGRGSGVRGLLGELLGMIVLPYEGAAAARRQIKRDAPNALVLAPERDVASTAELDPLASLPMRLTYRTARVLQAVAKLTEPGVGVSNRQIAEHAGIGDVGQASKLLKRLAQHGLLENVAVGNRERGEANQWLLTQTGQRVVQCVGLIERTRHRSAA